MVTDDQVNFFNKNGYLVLEPTKIFSDVDIDNLKTLSNQTFLNYIEGEEKFYTNSQNYKDSSIYLKKVQYYKNGNTTNKNILFARRATCMGWQLNGGLSNYIENENLQACVKKLLNAKNLSLHTSALIKVYPGCVGEEDRLHVDLPGFVTDPFYSIKKNRFVLNTLIYLDDVNEELAPLRVVPFSHKNYLKINDHLKLKQNIKKKYINLLGASDMGIKEKVIKELNYETKPLTGKTGTVIFMSGNLLHSATANKTQNSRLHFNFNFSCREHLEIRKFNFRNIKSSDCNIVNCLENFKDKQMLKRSYVDSYENKFLNKYFEYRYKILNRLFNLI